jgi:hypothetical protein
MIIFVLIVRLLYKNLKDEYSSAFVLPLFSAVDASAYFVSSESALPQLGNFVSRKLGLAAPRSFLRSGLVNKCRYNKSSFVSLAYCTRFPILSNFFGAPRHGWTNGVIELPSYRTKVYARDVRFNYSAR